MATWRCPNCGTFQAESSRCFMCGRSATSCATCVNFRESLVGGLGYCANDKRREPLTGAEQRSCWTSAVSTAMPPTQTSDSSMATLLDLVDSAAAEAHQPRGALRPVSGR